MKIKIHTQTRVMRFTPDAKTRLHMIYYAKS